MIRTPPLVNLDGSSPFVSRGPCENDNEPRRSGGLDAPLPPLVRQRVEGHLLASTGDLEGALVAFRKALWLLGPGDPEARADLYVCIGEVRWAKGDFGEARTDFHRALQLVPAFRPALDALAALAAATRRRPSLVRARAWDEVIRVQTLVGAIAQRYARAEMIARRAGARALVIRIAAGDARSASRVAGARR